MGNVDPQRQFWGTKGLTVSAKMVTAVLATALLFSHHNLHSSRATAPSGERL